MGKALSFVGYNIKRFEEENILKKVLKLNALVLLGSVSLTVITPATLVYANDIQTESVGKGITLNDVDELTKIKYDCRDLGFVLSYNKKLNGEINENERLSDYKNSYLEPSLLTSTPVAKLNNDMVLENGSPVAAHNASLTNNTGTEQRLSSAAFEYRQSDSVTTQTSHAVGGSLTTSAEMKFPFISGSMSIEAHYDFGHTNAVTSTEDKIWSVPSQSLLIPAKHTYKLLWILNEGTASGTVDLDCEVSAQIPFKKNPNHPTDTMKYPIGDAISEQERLVNILQDSAYTWEMGNRWQRIDSNTATKKLTNAKYKAKIGTELLLSVYDVTDGKNNLVEVIPTNVIPKKVAPKID